MILKILFFAIDFSDLEQSKRLISKIQKYIGGIKIGLEFFQRTVLQDFLKFKNLKYQSF